MDVNNRFGNAYYVLVYLYFEVREGAALTTLAYLAYYARIFRVAWFDMIKSLNILAHAGTLHMAESSVLVIIHDFLLPGLSLILASREREDFLFFVPPQKLGLLAAEGGSKFDSLELVSIRRRRRGCKWVSVACSYS